MKPTNTFVGPMLTDLYEITMAYGYWKYGKHNDKAVFDLFFRKNPFGGEFTVFAGLEEVIRCLHAFRFTDDDIRYLRYGFVREKNESRSSSKRVSRTALSGRPPTASRSSASTPGGLSPGRPSSTRKTICG